MKKKKKPLIAFSGLHDGTIKFSVSNRDSQDLKITRIYLTYDGWQNRPGPDMLYEINDIHVEAEDLGDVEVLSNGKKTNISKIEKDYIVKSNETISYIFKVKSIQDISLNKVDIIRYETMKIYIQYQSSSFTRSYTEVILVRE